MSESLRTNESLKRDMMKRGLTEWQVESLHDILNEMVDARGREFSDYSEDEMVDVLCEPAQYLDEMLDHVVITLWRSQLYGS